MFGDQEKAFLLAQGVLDMRQQAGPPEFITIAEGKKENGLCKMRNERGWCEMEGSAWNVSSEENTQRFSVIKNPNPSSRSEKIEQSPGEKCLTVTIYDHKEK